MAGQYHSRGAQLLNDALRARGMSFGELERELGIAAGMVSRWLSGERRASLRHALHIETLLGVAAAEWLQPPSDVVAHTPHGDAA